jgi:predicted small lipoprotein YifL
LKTFLLISFLLIALNIISCGQKGDLIRPQHASEHSVERPQVEQNEKDQSLDEPEKDKN